MTSTKVTRLFAISAVRYSFCARTVTFPAGSQLCAARGGTAEGGQYGVRTSLLVVLRREGVRAFDHLDMARRAARAPTGGGSAPRDRRRRSAGHHHRRVDRLLLRPSCDSNVISGISAAFLPQHRPLRISVSSAGAHVHSAAVRGRRPAWGRENGAGLRRAATGSSSPPCSATLATTSSARIAGGRAGSSGRSPRWGGRARRVPSHHPRERLEQLLELVLPAGRRLAAPSFR